VEKLKNSRFTLFVVYFSLVWYQVVRGDWNRWGEVKGSQKKPNRGHSTNQKKKREKSKKGKPIQEKKGDGYLWGRKGLRPAYETQQKTSFQMR